MQRFHMQFVHMLCVGWVKWCSMVLRGIGRLKAVTHKTKE
jgi:hypothetical protein